MTGVAKDSFALSENYRTDQQQKAVDGENRQPRRTIFLSLLTDSGWSNSIGSRFKCIKAPMPDDYANEPYLWQSVYELAVAEPNPASRQQLLIEAQTAMLQRAEALEAEGGSDSECTALETAAENLREMKVNKQSDGSGKPPGSGKFGPQS